MSSPSADDEVLPALLAVEARLRRVRRLLWAVNALVIVVVLIASVQAVRHSGKRYGRASELVVRTFVNEGRVLADLERVAIAHVGEAREQLVRIWPELAPEMRTQLEGMAERAQAKARKKIKAEPKSRKKKPHVPMRKRLRKAFPKLSQSDRAKATWAAAKRAAEVELLHALDLRIERSGLALAQLEALLPQLSSGPWTEPWKERVSSDVDALADRFVTYYADDSAHVDEEGGEGGVCREP